MQQTMVNYICLNNIIITILVTLSFISCAPSEPKLELQLEKQTKGLFGKIRYSAQRLYEREELK